MNYQEIFQKKFSIHFSVLQFWWFYFDEIASSILWLGDCIDNVSWEKNVQFIFFQLLFDFYDMITPSILQLGISDMSCTPLICLYEYRWLPADTLFSVVHHRCHTLTS